MIDDQFLSEKITNKIISLTAGAYDVILNIYAKLEERNIEYDYWYPDDISIWIDYDKCSLLWMRGEYDELISHFVDLWIPFYENKFEDKVLISKSEIISTAKQLYDEENNPS